MTQDTQDPAPTGLTAAEAFLARPKTWRRRDIEEALALVRRLAQEARDQAARAEGAERALREVRDRIPLIVGEPMVCEQHPWRLWEVGHIEEGKQVDDCSGPGMPLSAVKGYLEQRAEGAEREAARLREALARTASFIDTWRDCLDGVQMDTELFLRASGLPEARAALAPPQDAGKEAR